MEFDPFRNHQKSLPRGQQFFGLVYYQTSHDLVALQPMEKELQVGRPLEELPSWLLPRLVQTGVFQGEEINQVGMIQQPWDMMGI